MEKYIAKVAKVVSPTEVVINAGLNKGLKKHDIVLIIRLGNIILDPDTKEELGELELVLGEATVTHVQEKMATLESAIYKSPKSKKSYRPTFLGSLEPTIEETTLPTEKEPFKDVVIGDHILLV